MSENEKNNSGLELDLSNLLHNYFQAAKRFWWLLAASTVLFGALVPFIYGLFAKPTYTASCTFTVRVVSNSVTESLDTEGGIFYDKDLAEQLKKTFTYILTSDHLSDEVRARMGRELDAGRIEATCLEGSNVFTINATGDTAQDAYDTLMSVMEVFPTAARYVVGDLHVDIVEEAKVPKAPTAGLSSKLLLLIGCVLGFAGASIIIMIPVWAKRTVHKPEELEALLNMPCLGLVPVTTEYTEGQDAARREGEFKESVRGIARKLESRLEQDGCKVLLITSTMSGEGKSLLCRHMAQTLASWGKQVYLVDADLRKPSLYRGFHLKGLQMPLEAFLRGNASAHTVIREIGQSGLKLVGNTLPVQEPTVLLDSAAMKKLLTDLQSEADFVIVDAPPCDALADVLVLQRYADRILYVVRQDMATIKSITDTVENLSTDESKFIGYVLNGTAKTAGGYGKYGYGAYSYGKYGNGYYGKYGHYDKYSKYYHTEQAEGISEK